MATLGSLQAGNRVPGEQHSAGNHLMCPGSARQISFRGSPMLLASPGLFSHGCPQFLYYSFKHGFPTITAAQGSRKSGTRIFTSNKTEESTSDDEQKPKFGTQFFGLGKKTEPNDVEEQEEEEEIEVLPGTQFFRTISGKVNDWNKTVRGGGQGLVPISTSPKDLGGFKLPRRQDPNTVFVSGATGQIGARVAQRLLREGFSIRGGVRDLFVAQQLAEFATQYGVISREEAKRLNAVEFDLKNIESIAKAMGAATKVVVTIGPNEDGPKSKVSFEDASNVIEAAKLAQIANIVVVYEPGTGGTVDNPLAGLASFFSELFSKPVAVSLLELIDQIVDSKLQYTILKTASTDGVDDTSPVSEVIDVRKESVTSVVSTDQSIAKISKGQVASVVAEIVSNPAVAENKVVEVFTSSAASAIAKPITELLESIPIDGRRERLFTARAKAEEEEQKQAERARVEAEARAAVEESRRAASLAAQLEAEAKKLAAEEARAASLAEKAQAQAAAAAASLDGLASRMKELGIGGVSSKSKGSSISPLSAAIATAKDGTTSNSPLLNFNNIQFPSFAKPVKVVADEDEEQPSPAPVASVIKNKKTRKPKPKPVVEESPKVAPAAKPQVNNIFGGLFQQETVYIDEV